MAQTDSGFRYFHISDVLSVITGRLVSNRHKDGLFDIVGYVAGDPGISDHQEPGGTGHKISAMIGLHAQAPRVQEELLSQHPELKGVESTFPDLSRFPDKEAKARAVKEWVSEQATKFGDTLKVRPAKIAIALDKDEQTEIWASMIERASGSKRER